MPDIERLIAELAAWGGPRVGVGDNPLRLACSLDGGATETEIASAWKDVRLPKELRELWLRSRTARLFEDVDYGQWGLKLLSPKESADRTAREKAARPTEFRPNDIVAGEFLGDQELLVVAPETSNGDVLVALPLDQRGDWYHAAPSIAAFLREYLDADGEKFWESQAKL